MDLSAAVGNTGCSCQVPASFLCWSPIARSPCGREEGALEKTRLNPSGGTLTGYPNWGRGDEAGRGKAQKGANEGEQEEGDGREREREKGGESGRERERERVAPIQPALAERTPTRSSGHTSLGPPQKPRHRQSRDSPITNSKRTPYIVSGNE